jgi:hypothetical protein
MGRLLFFFWSSKYFFIHIHNNMMKKRVEFGNYLKESVCWRVSGLSLHVDDRIRGAINELQIMYRKKQRIISLLRRNSHHSDIFILSDMLCDIMPKKRSKFAGATNVSKKLLSIKYISGSLPKFIQRFQKYSCRRTSASRQRGLDTLPLCFGNLLKGVGYLPAMLRQPVKGGWIPFRYASAACQRGLDTSPPCFGSLSKGVGYLPAMLWHIVKGGWIPFHYALAYCQRGMYLFPQYFGILSKGVGYLKVYLSGKDSYPEDDTLWIPRVTNYRDDDNDDDDNRGDNAGIVSGTGNMFTLSQNIPNPANSSMRIDYSIPETGTVMFHIHSVSGQLLYSEIIESASGKQSLELNTSTFAPGIYFYSIKCKEQRLIKRSMINKLMNEGVKFDASKDNRLRRTCKLGLKEFIVVCF